MTDPRADAALEKTSSLVAEAGGPWLALPPRTTPRVLVEQPHLALDPGALRDVLGHTSTVRRGTIGLAARALAIGGHRLLPHRPGWEAVAGRLLHHARSVAGMPDAFGIIRVSPGRPNSKPVVQLVSRDGTDTLAWVKIGWDDQTRPLVLHEAAVLRSLAPPPTLRIPPILGLDEGPVAALVLGPLVRDAASRRTATPRQLAAVALEVFGPDGFGVDGESRVADLPVLEEETAVLLTAPDNPLTDRLRSARDRFVDRFGDLVVPIGRWHGDWNRANAALDGGGVAAWDWERSRRGAPLGLDAAFALMFLLSAEEARRTLTDLLPDHAPEHRRMLLSLGALCSVSRHTERHALGIATDWQPAVERLDAHLRP